MYAQSPWVLKDLEGLADLAAGWSSLATTADPPTEHPDWTDAAARTVAAGSRLCVVGVGPPDRPRALAPLVRASSSVGHWRQVGASDLGEPADLLYADTAAAEELVETLLSLRLPVMLNRLPSDSEVLKAVLATGNRRALVLVRPGDGAPYLELDASWREPERRLSTSRRGALRRARRRAESQGELTVHVARPAPHEVPAVLDEAFEVESRSWKGRCATALAHDARRAAFYRRYAASAAAAGTFVSAFLRLDGRAIAMQLAIDAGSHHWVLKIGFDEEYSRCSPGNLLTAEMIQDTANRGLTRYEFLGSPSPWIDAWTTARHSLANVSLAPLSPTGVAASMSEVARLAAHRWRERRPGRAEGPGSTPAETAVPPVPAQVDKSLEAARARERGAPARAGSSARGGSGA